MSESLIAALRRAEELRLPLNEPPGGTKQMAQTYNHDIVGITQRIDRYCVEINRAASGNIAGVISHDMKRWKSYIVRLREYTVWVVDQPSPLDLPETHPSLLNIEDPAVYDPVDNLLANDIVRLLLIGRNELINSQSSSVSSGLGPHDLGRWFAVLDKIEAAFELGEATSPLDLPESLPHYPGVREGNTGVHTPADTLPTP